MADKPGRVKAAAELPEASVRMAEQRGRNQADFVAKGMRSLDDARRTGQYVDADVVLQMLQRKLDEARMRKRAVPR